MGVQECKERQQCKHEPFQVEAWGLDRTCGVLEKRIEFLKAQHSRNSTDNYERFSKLLESILTTSVDAKDIERVDRRDLCEMEFLNNYVAKGRPCIVSGCCEGWAAYETWRSAEALERSHGGVEVRLADWVLEPGAVGTPLRVPLANYIRYANDFDSIRADFPWYAFEEDWAESRTSLLSDFAVPDLFRDDVYDVSPDTRAVFPNNTFFVCGGARSGTLLHIDPQNTSAWNTLLCGRKKWVLYPPGTAAEYKKLLGMRADGDGYDKLATYPCRWWGEEYPRIMERISQTGAPGVEAIECVQEAGETIYVPAGWWHAVLNLDFTVAVTANPLLPSSLDAVWDSLRSVHPPHFLHKMATLAAEKWPEYLALDKISNMHLARCLRGEVHEHDVAVSDLHRIGARLGQPSGGLLFLDATSAVGREEGGLDPCAVVLLKALLDVTGCEVVLTCSACSSDSKRKKLVVALARWDVHVSKWLAPGHEQGDKSSKILDFVHRYCTDNQRWAVIDSSPVGDAQGLLMMQVLYSRSVALGQGCALGAESALEACKILFDVDDEQDHDN